jgi:hypothetical protein
MSSSSRSRSSSPRGSGERDQNGGVKVAHGIVAVALATVALPALLAGCTSAEPVTKVTVPGLIGGAGGTPAAPIATTDVCAAMPVAAVAKASGWRLAGATAEQPTYGTVTASACTYTGSSGTLRLLVIPDGGDAAVTALMASPELGGGTITVTGLGDAAQAALHGIAVRYGQDVVAVVDTPAGTALPLATTQGLATSLHDALAR